MGNHIHDRAGEDIFRYAVKYLHKIREHRNQHENKQKRSGDSGGAHLVLGKRFLRAIPRIQLVRGGQDGDRGKDRKEHFQGFHIRLWG